MGEFLKNALATAAMVIGATLLTSVIAGLSVALASSPDQMAGHPLMAIVGIAIAGVAALAFGIFFCVVTLFLTAVTMPPTLLAARWLNLPRPAVDVVGGGAVGLLCSSNAVEFFDGYKLAGMISGASADIISVLAVIVGGGLGYLRHRVMARQDSAEMTALPV